MSSPSIPASKQASHQQTPYPLTSSGPKSPHTERSKSLHTREDNPTFAFGGFQVRDRQDRGVEGEGRRRTVLCEGAEAAVSCLEGEPSCSGMGVINTLQHQMGSIELSLLSALRPHPQIGHLREKQKGGKCECLVAQQHGGGGGYKKGIGVITDICATETGDWQRVGVEGGEGATERPDRLVNSLGSDKKPPTISSGSVSQSWEIGLFDKDLTGGGGREQGLGFSP